MCGLLESFGALHTFCLAVFSITMVSLFVMTVLCCSAMLLSSISEQHTQKHMHTHTHAHKHKHSPNDAIGLVTAVVMAVMVRLLKFECVNGSIYFYFFIFLITVPKTKKH